MSINETWSGTIRLVPLEDGQTYEEKAEQILKESGDIEHIGNYDSAIECLRCESIEDYIVLHNIPYILDATCITEHDTKYKLNEDKSISFLTTFSNTGADLAEVLEKDIKIYSLNQLLPEKRS